MNVLRTSALIAALAIALTQAPTPEQLVTAAAAETHGPKSTSPRTDRAPVDQPLWRLAVAGDVGTGDDNQYRTAEVMAEAGRHDPFDALVLLGDNVYPNGDPERLDVTVFEPYGPVLAAGAELLPVLGNHDVRDDHGDLQVAALGMPARWYSHDFGELRLIAIDSTQPDNAEQLAWLERTLETADEEWIVTAMHHPPYSAGHHGSDLTARESFSHLFEAYGVDLVLAGHDHDYQRSRVINGVTYVVSGGAAKLRPTGQSDFTAVSYSTLHFTEVAVFDDRIEVTAINLDGVFDHAVVGSVDEVVQPASTVSFNPVQFVVLALGIFGLAVANLLPFAVPDGIAQHLMDVAGAASAVSLVVAMMGTGILLVY